MENLVGVGSAQIALSQKTLLNSLPQICLILSNLLKLNTEILVDVGKLHCPRNLAKIPILIF